MRFVIASGYKFPRLEAEISVFKHGIGCIGIEALQHHKCDRVPFLRQSTVIFFSSIFFMELLFFHFHVLTWFAYVLNSVQVSVTLAMPVMNRASVTLKWTEKKILYGETPWNSLIK